MWQSMHEFNVLHVIMRLQIRKMQLAIAFTAKTPIPLKELGGKTIHHKEPNKDKPLKVPKVSVDAKILHKKLEVLLISYFDTSGRTMIDSDQISRISSALCWETVTSLLYTEPTLQNGGNGCLSTAHHSNLSIGTLPYILKSILRFPIKLLKVYLFSYDFLIMKWTCTTKPTSEKNDMHLNVKQKGEFCLWFSW